MIAPYSQRIWLWMTVLNSGWISSELASISLQASQAGSKPAMRANLKIETALIGLFSMLTVHITECSLPHGAGQVFIVLAIDSSIISLVVLLDTGTVFRHTNCLYLRHCLNNSPECHQCYCIWCLAIVSLIVPLHPVIHFATCLGTITPICSYQPLCDWAG